MCSLSILVIFPFMNCERRWTHEFVSLLFSRGQPRSELNQDPKFVMHDIMALDLDLLLHACVYYMHVAQLFRSKKCGGSMRRLCCVH